jgi:hypothetical protein
MTTDNIEGPLSKRTKTKTVIFNFPLSQAVRDQIEELANLWDLSLAAVIRRSIDTAHIAEKTQTPTVAQEAIKQDNIAILETLITIHTDLATTKSNMDSILTGMSIQKDVLTKLEKLSHDVTTLIQAHSLNKTQSCQDTGCSHTKTASTTRATR